jgi:hypothetical protein
MTEQDAESSDEQQVDREIDETLPEVVKDFLRSGAELEEIRLDERGEWTHEGLDFENERIIGLFDRSVNRTEGGTWVLEVGRFTYPITVDDVGFFVERFDDSTDPPTLKLSDETEEPLVIDSLDYEAGGKLYCSIKDGEFRARFKRPAYYDAVDYVIEEDGELIFEYGDQRQRLADIDEIERAEGTG